MMMGTASDAEFERIADLVRRDDPALTAMRLDPDGTYQTRTATLDSLREEVKQCLADGFRRRGSDEFHAYCAWAGAASDRLALANLFGVAGLPHISSR